MWCVKITFLGTGGAFTDYRVNYHNNALIETAEGPVLLDCGTTACQSMRELGVKRGDVRAVLFTHLHADHASPEQLIWERFYAVEGPGGPGFHPTTLVGPPDLLDPLGRSLHPFLDAFTDRDGVMRLGGVEALVRPVATTEVEIGGVGFRWFRVPHVTGDGVDKAAYGLRIDDGRNVVWWSGDTAFAPRWIQAAAEEARTARIFHECLFYPPFRGTVHSHWSELLTLDPAVAARVTLMHHTAVPAGVELGDFAGAALRHEVFDL